MTLKQWLETNGFSDAEFARLMSEFLKRPVSAQSVFQYKRGTMPKWDVGDAISRLTGGRVKSGSFVRKSVG
jgi:hypothetical protein